MIATDIQNAYNRTKWALVLRGFLCVAAVECHHSQPKKKRQPDPRRASDGSSSRAELALLTRRSAKESEIERERYKNENGEQRPGPATHIHDSDCARGIFRIPGSGVFICGNMLINS